MSVAFSKFCHLLRRPLVLAAHLCVCVVLVLPGRVLGHGAYHEVLDEVTQALKTDPANPALLFRLAAAQCDHGDAKATLDTLDRVEALDARRFPIDLVRGQALLIADNAREALVVLNRFLDNQATVDALSDEALRHRGRALVKLGEVAEALVDYRTILKRTNPTGPDLVLEVAAVMTENAMPDEAMDVLATGIERIGPEPALVLRAMELEIAQGRFDAALQRADLMRQSAPSPEPWMARRAEILALAKRGDESRAAWTDLAAHIAKLPSLSRGTSHIQQLLQRAQNALGAPVSSAPVIAPPSSSSRLSSSTVTPSNP